MNVECQFCHSINFSAEESPDKTFKYCCHKGAVSFEGAGQAVREFPPALKDLLSNPQHHNYRHFKDNIRSYNRALSFTSMGAQIAHITGHGNGSWTDLPPNRSHASE